MDFFYQETKALDKILHNLWASAQVLIFYPNFLFL
jgi:hypothetical protein